METTLGAIITLINLKLDPNDPTPIDVTLLGMVTLVTFLQLLYALLGMLRHPLGILTYAPQAGRGEVGIIEGRKVGASVGFVDNLIVGFVVGLEVGFLVAGWTKVGADDGVTKNTLYFC